WDPGPAAQWAAGAPAPIRVHAVTGLTRSARVLQDRSIHILAGAVPDLTALVARSALKLDSISTVVIAWPELLAAGEHAAALDTLLGAARGARPLRHADRLRGGRAAPVPALHRSAADAAALALRRRPRR